MWEVISLYKQFVFKKLDKNVNAESNDDKSKMEDEKEEIKDLKIKLDDDDQVDKKEKVEELKFYEIEMDEILNSPSHNSRNIENDQKFIWYLD